MKINKNVIKHVAEVARLELTGEEIREFLPQLKEILKTLSKIQEVDTKNTLPSYHAVDIKNALREDTPRNSLSQDEALKNTKNKKDGYFMGPKVV